MDTLSPADSVVEEELGSLFGIVTEDDGELVTSSRAVRGTAIDTLWDDEPDGIT
jgi:hypothetical protein